MVHVGSQACTAFVTPDGQYQFRKVPFGLCNSPAVFQRYVNMVLNDLIRRNIVTVYMDDLIIASKTEHENFEKLRMVLAVAEQHGMVIKFKKCHFLKRRGSFIGHILEGGCVRPSEEKTLAIREFPQPKTVKQVQSFLGLAGYFRKFVHNFSLTAKPLTELTKKEVPFVFGGEQQEAFAELKRMLMS